MQIIQIHLSDIYAYVGDRIRPLREGEEVFKAGHYYHVWGDWGHLKIMLGWVTYVLQQKSATLPQYTGPKGKPLG